MESLGFSTFCLPKKVEQKRARRIIPKCRDKLYSQSAEQLPLSFGTTVNWKVVMLFNIYLGAAAGIKVDILPIP